MARCRHGFKVENEAPRRPRFVESVKAERIVQVGHERVLLGGDEFSQEPTITERPARAMISASVNCSTVRPMTRQLISQVSNRSVFEGNSFDGTPMRRRSSRDRRSDPSNGRSGRSLPNSPAAPYVLARVSASRQVELVRLRQELNHALHVGVVDRADVRNHLKPGEIIVHRGEPFGAVAPFPLDGVLLGAFAIGVGHADRLEPETALQGAMYSAGFFAEFDDFDVGLGLPDLFCARRGCRQGRQSYPGRD